MLGIGHVFKDGKENVLPGCDRAIPFIDERTAAHGVEVTSPRSLSP